MFRVLSEPIRWSIESPRAVFTGVMLLLAAAAPGLVRLELGTDGLALLDPEAPEVVADRAARARFAIDDQVVCVLETEDPRGILVPDSLERVVALTERIEALPELGPGSVRSLATEGSDRVRPGTLEFVPWLTPLPRTDAELERLALDLDDARVYRGTLVSDDSPPSATALLVSLPREEARARIVRELREALSEVELGAHRLHVVGAPIAESTLGHHLLLDLALLVPLGLGVMVAFFWLVFRRAAAAVLPLLEVGFGLVCCLGLLGWLGIPVYLTVAVLPVILTAVGVADELHVFSCFLATNAETLEERVAETYRRMTRPVLQTSLTTAVGFLSFALSPLVPVRTFGVFMALGVLLCMLWTLFVLPALLVSLPARAWDRPRGALAAPRLAGFLTRNRRVLAIGMCAILAALGVFLPRLRVQDSWLSGFAEDSELARSTAFVDEHFGGAHLLRVAIRGERVRHEGVMTRDLVEGDRLLLPDVAVEEPGLLVGHLLRLDALGGRHPASKLPIVHATETPDGVRITVAAGLRPLESWLTTHRPELAFTIDGSERMLLPVELERVRALEELLSRRADLGVGRVLGPASHLEAMHFMLRQRAPEAHCLPETKDRVSLVVDRYRDVRGDEGLREIFDERFAEGLVTLFLKGSNYASTRELLAVIEEFAARELEPNGLLVTLAGDVATSQTMISGIVRTELLSLGVSLLGILVVSSLFCRSVWRGVLCTLPSLASILGVLSLMGLVGVPLGVASSMFCAIVLGIGVDYAVHLVHRLETGDLARIPHQLPTQHTPSPPWHTSWQAFGAERCSTGRRGPASAPFSTNWCTTTDLGRTGPKAGEGSGLELVLTETSPALLLDALAIGSAFSLLALSRVPANALLGTLVVSSLALCLAVTLCVVPAWAVRATNRHSRDEIRGPRSID